MKKFKLLLLAILAITTVIVTSCKKDEEKVLIPTINFIAATGYTSADASLPVSTVFNVKITSKQGADGEKLNQFKVVRIFNNTPTTVLDSTGFSLESFDFDGSFITNSVAGNETWFFYIYDKDGNTENISFVITTTTVGPPPVTYNPINTYSAKLLGAQSAAAGSFFASSTGNIYSQSQAAANAATIDITYGVLSAANGLESFISPSARATYGFTAVAGATVTNFGVSTITATAFDALTNDSLIKDIPTLSDLKVSNIAQGGVYSFINAAGKKGLIKVTALTTGTSGNVTISVKVQQ